MRFLLKVRMPNDAGNAAIQDPEFGTKLQGLPQRRKRTTANDTPR